MNLKNLITLQKPGEKIPCQPIKYSECFGLPPISPIQNSLFSTALSEGMYTGLTTSPPRRIGTMMTTDRQRLPQDDSTKVSAEDVD